MTGGRGRFVATHSHYDPVPAHLVDKVRRRDRGIAGPSPAFLRGGPPARASKNGSPAPPRPPPARGPPAYFAPSGAKGPSMSSSPPPAGWYRDPARRFDHRYWNGTAWTTDVMIDGVRLIDGVHTIDDDDRAPEPAREVETQVAAPPALAAPRLGPGARGRRAPRDRRHLALGRGAGRDVVVHPGRHRDRRCDHHRGRGPDRARVLRRARPRAGRGLRRGSAHSSRARSAPATRSTRRARRRISSSARRRARRPESASACG